MQLKTFDELRAQFLDFYNSIKAGHENTKKQSRGGHGVDHDITVAMLAVKISTNERVGQKAWCAGMLHSTDRVVEMADVIDSMAKHADHLKHFFSRSEISEIIEAAFRHSELNQSDQSETQIILMDADRLANMQSAVIIRSGQFKPDIPVFDFKHLSGEINPLSTYEDPKSVLDDLRFVIKNYIPQFRTDEAKRLGSIYAIGLSAYIKAVEEENESLGLLNIEI